MTLIPKTTVRAPQSGHVTPPQGRVRFGTGLTGFTGMMSSLEQKPLAELVMKDVMAFNAPKIAMARTWSERLDTAMLELTNTSITLLASLTVPLALRYPVSKLSGVAHRDLVKEIPYSQLAQTSSKIRMARMATSFGFFFPFAGAFWAAPFLRNWLTAKKNHSSDFESMIGLGPLHPNKQQPDKRSWQEELAYQKHTGFTVLGLSTALGVSAATGLSWLARSMNPTKPDSAGNRLAHTLETKYKNLWSTNFNKFDLKGASGNQIAGGRATLLFWGLPAYLGWVHGARSNNERRERLLQSANALFWFFVAPAMVGKIWTPAMKDAAGELNQWDSAFVQRVQDNLPLGKNSQPLTELEKKTGFLKKIASDLSYEEIKNHFKGTDAERSKLFLLKNSKFAVAGLAVPILSLAAVQVVNFRWTERKVRRDARKQRAQLMKSQLPGIQSPVTATPKSMPALTQPQVIGLTSAAIVPEKPTLFSPFTTVQSPPLPATPAKAAMSATAATPPPFEGNTVKQPVNLGSPIQSTVSFPPVAPRSMPLPAPLFPPHPISDHFTVSPALTPKSTFTPFDNNALIFGME